MPGGVPDDVGVGLGLEKAGAYEDVVIAGCVPGGAAHESGAILPGDVLLAVNGATFFGQPLGRVRAAIRGPKNTRVRLSLRRMLGHGMSARDFDVDLVRKSAPKPPAPPSLEEHEVAGATALDISNGVLPQKRERQGNAIDFSAAGCIEQSGLWASDGEDVRTPRHHAECAASEPLFHGCTGTSAASQQRKELWPNTQERVTLSADSRQDAHAVSQDSAAPVLEDWVFSSSATGGGQGRTGGGREQPAGEIWLKSGAEQDDPFLPSLSATPEARQPVQPSDQIGPSTGGAGRRPRGDLGQHSRPPLPSPHQQEKNTFCGDSVHDEEMHSRLIFLSTENGRLQRRVEELEVFLTMSGDHEEQARLAKQANRDMEARLQGQLDRIEQLKLDLNQARTRETGLRDKIKHVPALENELLLLKGGIKQNRRIFTDAKEAALIQVGLLKTILAEMAEVRESVRQEGVEMLNRGNLIEKERREERERQQEIDREREKLWERERAGERAREREKEKMWEEERKMEREKQEAREREREEQIAQERRAKDAEKEMEQRVARDAAETAENRLKCATEKVEEMQRQWGQLNDGMQAVAETIGATEDVLLQVQRNAGTCALHHAASKQRFVSAKVHVLASMGKTGGVLAELIHVCAEARRVLAACMMSKEETVRIQNEAQEAQEEQWRLQNRVLSLRKELAGLEHKHHHAKVSLQVLQSEVERVKDALGKRALELESEGTNFFVRDKRALAREGDRVICAGVGRDVLQIELQEPLHGMLQINQRMLQLIREIGVEERAGGNYPQRSEPLQNILEGHQLQAHKNFTSNSIASASHLVDPGAANREQGLLTEIRELEVMRERHLLQTEKLLAEISCLIDRKNRETEFVISAEQQLQALHTRKEAVAASLKSVASGALHLIVDTVAAQKDAHHIQFALVSLHEARDTAQRDLVRARQEARGLKEIVSNLKMEEARTRQAVQELKDERTHTELIIQRKENVQSELEALNHEVSRVDKKLAELRGLENQAQETLKGLKEKESKARSELLTLHEECKQGETEAEGLRNTRAQCEQLKRMLATQNFQYNEKAQQLLEMESTGTKLLAELEKMQARADTARDQYVRLERRVLRMRGNLRDETQKMRADLLSVKDGNESCAGDWCGTRGQEMDFSDVRSLSCELDASKRSQLPDCSSASNNSDAAEGFEGPGSNRRDKLLKELHVLHYDLCSLASV